jgi:altronate hydrolase
VAVALQKLRAGSVITLEGRNIILKEDIPPGHKLSLFVLKKGDLVIKYGYSIGRIACDLEEGCWVHEKNLHSALGGVSEYEYHPESVRSFLPAPDFPKTFQGYLRENGEVGIRNQLWIIPTVGCVNGIVSGMASLFRREIGEKSGVDEVIAFPHPWGCSQLGEDHENTRKILKNMVLHPNAGGVLVVGLGCENNQVDAFRDFVGPVDSRRVRYMVCQQEEDELETGLRLLRELYLVASRDERIAVPFSSLRVGLKCGGSDGFSGITANPLLGLFSDEMIAAGGTTVLTEVSEMFGAETILMNRCINRNVFHDTVEMINHFKQYFLSNGQPVYENPSPGNKAGGISTLEEKSLGCTQKSGTSPVQGVLQYGELLKNQGLHLLSAPGNDLVAATALAASGCHLVLFTTGRGTPFGTFVPTLKISTNTGLYRKKPSWIDFNAGAVLETETMEQACSRLSMMVQAVAEGQMVNHEKLGDRGLSIFKTGVTL